MRVPVPRWFRRLLDYALAVIMIPASIFLILGSRGFWQIFWIVIMPLIIYLYYQAISPTGEMQNNLDMYGFIGLKRKYELGDIEKTLASFFLIKKPEKELVYLKSHPELLDMRVVDTLESISLNAYLGVNLHFALLCNRKCELLKNCILNKDLFSDSAGLLT